MKTNFTLLVLILILGACSSGDSHPEVLPTLAATEVPSPPTLTPISDFSPTQCGYQWAFEDLPELSALFDEAIKSLIPNSSSRASAFGENCLDNDGQVAHFLVMETDYYVTVSVETLNDHETLGNWIAQVMQIVKGLPPDLIRGPQPGFVEFRFEKYIEESITFRVPIQGYVETANGKSGEELFRLFYTNP